MDWAVTKPSFHAFIENFSEIVISFFDQLVLVQVQQFNKIIFGDKIGDDFFENSISWYKVVTITSGTLRHGESIETGNTAPPDDSDNTWELLKKWASQWHLRTIESE